MRRSGPRASSSGGYRLLRQRIAVSAPDPSLDAESVALSLRNYYSEYRRLKLRPFSRQVQQVLASLHHSPTTVIASCNNTSRDGDEFTSPGTKHKRRRVSHSLSDEDSDGSMSTSTSEGDDLHLEPAFDVTKSVLREGYLKKSTLKEPKSKSAKVRHDNTIEIDVATEPAKISVSDGGSMEASFVDNSGQERKGGPRFADLGGMRGVIKELMMKVIVPLWYPELPSHLGIRPMTGLLLHGPPGCGKTTLACAIANETGVPLYKISAPEVVAGVTGASEDNIRTLFKKAYRTAPSIVFIDEIDAIASKRENLQREMERRIVTQLMTCMDQLHQVVQDQEPDFSQDKPPGHVLVIGATNRPDAIDQALRRPGRFDREIALGVPDEVARTEILSMLTQRLRLEGEFDLLKIARSTAGFVGADLNALVGEAGNLAIERIMNTRISSWNLEDWPRQPWDKAEMKSLSITMADFENAAKTVQPSLRREGFSSIPNVTWDDVGGLSLIRKVFERYIIRGIKHPECYKESGINLEAGFLLFGPPGCGKTLIAKVVAKEAGANFIHIKGPELLKKYVGESELEVRKIFARARTNSPCIIFFDEIDAITTRRGTEGGWVVERVLNQLLIELDGAGNRQDVYVIGATNRVEAMDPAVLRSGRFGKILYVPLPGADERVAIMKAHARNKLIDADVNLDALARADRCNNLSGADIASLINEAAMFALDERLELANEAPISYKCLIKASHLEHALSEISSSVSDRQREYYEILSKKYQAIR